MANIVKRNNGTAGVPAAGSLTPFGGLVDGVLQNTLSRFLDDDFWGFNGMLSEAQVPVNVRETDKSYEMEIVAPGLSKQQFNVNLNKNLLTVSFEHKEEDKEGNKGDDYLRREFHMRSFSRSFTLDETVDAEKISARYENGVLHLSLPKKETAQKLTRNIQVA
jgi:HSP20 family protein